VSSAEAEERRRRDVRVRSILDGVVEKEGVVCRKRGIGERLVGCAKALCNRLYAFVL